MEFVRAIFCGFLLLCLIQGTLAQCDVTKTQVHMCVEGSYRAQDGETVYIDAVMAPRSQTGMCNCTISNTRFSTTNLYMNYTVNKQSNADCNQTFSIGRNSWGCLSQTQADVVVGTPTTLYFVKTHEKYDLLYSCIEMRPAFGALFIQCYRSVPYNSTQTTPKPETPSPITTPTPKPETPTPTPKPTTTTTPKPETPTPTHKPTTTPKPTTTTTPKPETPTPTPKPTPKPTSTHKPPTTSTTTTTPSPSSQGTTKATTQPHITTTPIPLTTTAKRTEAPSTTNSPSSTTAKRNEVPTTTSYPSSGSSTRTDSEGPLARASTGGDGDSTWLYVGPIIGVCFLILFLLIVLCLVFRRRRRKEKPDPKGVEGPRTVRFSSSGDDVTVTENQLFNYDGETPATAMNALFIGGIPETPGAHQHHMPVFSSDPDAEYATIQDSHRSKGNARERPNLSTFKHNANEMVYNGASDDTNVKTIDGDPIEGPGGIDNPGYSPGYIRPYDNRSNGFLSTSSGADSDSPYSYADHSKVRASSDRSQAESENHYTRFPSDTVDEDGHYTRFPSKTTSEDGHYKRLISEASSEVPADGYMNSPTRDDAFILPDPEQK